MLAQSLDQLRIVRRDILVLMRIGSDVVKPFVLNQPPRLPHHDRAVLVGDRWVVFGVSHFEHRHAAVVDHQRAIFQVVLFSAKHWPPVVAVELLREMFFRIGEPGQRR